MILGVALRKIPLLSTEVGARGWRPAIKKPGRQLLGPGIRFYTALAVVDFLSSTQQSFLDLGVDVALAHEHAGSRFE